MGGLLRFMTSGRFAIASHARPPKWGLFRAGGGTHNGGVNLPDTQSRATNRRTPFLVFLARELAPREGRGLAVARMATACTITVAIAMVFQIPLAAYMAYMVFLISKDDIGATVTTAVGGALAVTLAVLFTLVSHKSRWVIRKSACPQWR